MDAGLRARGDVLSRDFGAPRRAADLRASRLLTAGAVLLGGCSVPEPMAVTPKAGPEAKATASERTEPEAASATEFPIGPRYAEVLERLTERPLPSRGHAAGRYDLAILANAIAARAWRGRARSMPVGAVFVAVHRELDGTPGPVLVMQKRAPIGGTNAWYYAFVGADVVPLRAGELADCKECHVQAETDAVFFVE